MSRCIFFYLSGWLDVVFKSDCTDKVSSDGMTVYIKQPISAEQQQIEQQVQQGTVKHLLMGLLFKDNDMGEPGSFLY